MVKEMNFNREQLPRFVGGAPQILDEYPEYWHDHEFCLLVFSENVYDQHSLPVQYLDQCKDEIVIAKALENYPKTLFLVSEENRRDKSMAMLAASSSSNCNALEKKDWVDSGKAITQMPWKHLEFVTHMVDKGHLVTARKYSPVKLSRYCNDPNWVRRRLKVHPSFWNEISPGLRKDRSLLMFALKSKKKIMRIPIGERGDMCAEFSINSLPVQFLEDEELLREAARLGTLGKIPQNDMNEAIVRAQLSIALSGESY